MSRQLDVVYYENSVMDGMGTVSANSTSEQAMKVTGDKTFAPQTDKDLPIYGWLLDSKAALATCTIVKSGVVRFTEISGGAAVGDEIEVGADGFPTKLTTGEERGLIIGTDGTKMIVSLYQ